MVGNKIALGSKILILKEGVACRVCVGKETLGYFGMEVGKTTMARDVVNMCRKAGGSELDMQFAIVRRDVEVAVYSPWKRKRV